MSTTPQAPSNKDSASLLEIIKAQEITINAQRIEIKLLRDKIDLLVRRIFGKSSEQMDEQQLMLLLQGEDSAPTKSTPPADATGLEAELAKGTQELKAKAPRAERKPRIPEHLPVSEEIIVDPDEVRAAPEAYRHINDEVTTQLDFPPKVHQAAHHSKKVCEARRATPSPHHRPARHLGRAQYRRPRTARANHRGQPSGARQPAAGCRVAVSAVGRREATIAIICRCIARSTSTSCATASNCPGKAWHAGSASPRSGSHRSMNASTLASWQAATCRPTL